MTAKPATLWIVAEVEPSQPQEPQRDARSSDNIGSSFCSPATDTLTATLRKRVPVDAVALKTQMNGLLQIVGDLFD